MSKMSSLPSLRILPSATQTVPFMPEESGSWHHRMSNQRRLEDSRICDMFAVSHSYLKNFTKSQPWCRDLDLSSSLLWLFACVWFMPELLVITDTDDQCRVTSSMTWILGRWWTYLRPENRSESWARHPSSHFPCSVFCPISCTIAWGNHDYSDPRLSTCPCFCEVELLWKLQGDRSSLLSSVRIHLALHSQMVCHNWMLLISAGASRGDRSSAYISDHKSCSIQILRWALCAHERATAFRINKERQVTRTAMPSASLIGIDLVLLY